MVWACLQHRVRVRACVCLCACVGVCVCARLLAAFREHDIKLPAALQPANQTALKPISVETQLQNISNALNERAGFTQLPSKDERKWSIDKVIANTQALLPTTGKHFREHYDSTHATSATPSRGADATNNKT